MSTATLVRPASLAERHEARRLALGLEPGEWQTIGSDGTRFTWSLSKAERARLDAKLRSIANGRQVSFAGVHAPYWGGR